jgi:hypothetical protein
MKLREVFTVTAQIRVYYAIVGGVVEDKSPLKMGAWGFQSRRELLNEKLTIERELQEVITELKSGGCHVEIYGGEIFDSEVEVFSKSEEIKRSDALLIFAAGPHGNVLRALLSFGKPTVVFVKSRETYYTFAEIFDARIVRMETDSTMLYDPHDVFVVYDDYGELAKVLRAIYAVYALKRSRVLYIGVPYGWQGRFNEIRAVSKKIGLDVVFLDHDAAYREAQDYLATDEARVEVENVVNRLKGSASSVELSDEAIRAAVEQYLGLKYLAKKYGANVVTISGCMMYGGSKWRVTPCLAFTLLDDDGLLGVCEGDMVNLVAKTLLRYLANRPAAFANPSIPVKGFEAVFAHCTAPTKMLGFDKPGFNYKLTTHFESDSPAAIKVYFEGGHKVTLLNLSFNLDRAVIARGEVMGYTDYPICRSQIKVRFSDTKKLYEEARGFHWSYVYGDYVDELRYALRLLKIDYVIVE